jgi:flagellin-specific chaperone FliS
MRKNIKKAMERINKIRQLMSKVRSPYRGMSKQEIIDVVRKTREKLWEEKLATHS